MNRRELIQFEAMRKSGALTFFDCGGCEVCGREIPNVKRFCSLVCKDVDIKRKEEGHG
jgi:hypothetical protein